MSITDELREWLRGATGGGVDTLLAIADRIDAEHRAALEKVASMVDACPLEARVSAIERLLNHKGVG